MAGLVPAIHALPSAARGFNVWMPATGAGTTGLGEQDRFRIGNDALASLLPTA